jgi:hypothetical protein
MRNGSDEANRPRRPAGDSDSRAVFAIAATSSVRSGFQEMARSSVGAIECQRPETGISAVASSMK